MILDLTNIILAILLIISIGLNTVLFFYIRKYLLISYNAADQASRIFVMLDAYRIHLKSVYEMPTFYGDETLSSLLEHTNDLRRFLEIYEDVYSLIEPDFLEKLKEEDIIDGTEKEEEE
jgi:hypothetical protein